MYRVTGNPRFLFEVWTAATKLAVPATWSNAGERSRLTRGKYGWAVYPAFGELGEANDTPDAATPIAGGHFSV